MNTRLFIGNLAYQAEEADISNTFKQLGFTPTSVKIIRDHESGNSRGFAFVDMANENDAARVLSQSNTIGFSVMGRDIVIREAEKKVPGSRPTGNRGFRNSSHVAPHSQPVPVETQPRRKSNRPQRGRDDWE